MNFIIEADNLAALKTLPDAHFDLVYIDPPFNTGHQQSRTQITTIRSDDGDRVGFGGNRYTTIKGATTGYKDDFEDLPEFLEPRLVEARRVLKPTGSLFFHIDYREVHYCKILLDTIFGRENFKNEIIWAYDYGARAKTRWPAKHDNILWYTVTPGAYTFNLMECDRIAYMAPELVGPEKAAMGKTPTDVWWHTIVSPTGKEKTGYATQKPLGIIERIIKVHTNPGEQVLDFFAGSGTTGEAAAKNEREFTLIDSNPQAIAIMRARLQKYNPA
jgi:site-specific DNA-methyltransferase (adenine-specific)